MRSKRTLERTTSGRRLSPENLTSRFVNLFSIIPSLLAGKCLRELTIFWKLGEQQNEKMFVKYLHCPHYCKTYHFKSTATFRLEYDDDYKYEFSALSTRCRFGGRNFSKCACLKLKSSRTCSRRRTPIWGSVLIGRERVSKCRTAANYSYKACETLFNMHICDVPFDVAVRVVVSKLPSIWTKLFKTSRCFQRTTGNASQRKPPVHSVQK